MKEGKQGAWWQPSLLLFGRMSGWIGGPVIVAILVGKWLDGKYGTEPWLFLLSVGLAFVISMFGIVRDAMKAMKEIDSESRKAPEKGSRSKESWGETKTS